MRTAPPIHSIRFYATLVFGSIILFASAFILQNLNSSQEIRSQAEQQTQATDEVSYRITTSPSTLVAGEEATLNFQINTNSLQISSIELRFVDIEAAAENAATFPESLTNTLPNKFSPFLNTLSGTQLNYFVALTNPSTGFQTNTFQTFATLTFTPQVAGDITFAYNTDHAIVPEFDGTANLLPFPGTHTITVAAQEESNTEEPAEEENTDECTETDVCNTNSCAYDLVACNAKNDDTDASDEGTKESDSTKDSTAACTAPKAPENVKAREGNKPGEIRVSWRAPQDTDHYAVSFGTQSGSYQYGSADIGNVREFILRYLDEGQRYYLVVAAVNECGSSPYSVETSALAASDPNASDTDDSAPTTPTTPKPKPQIIGISQTGSEILPEEDATPSATPNALNYPQRPPSANKTLGQRAVPYLFGAIILGLLAAGLRLVIKNRHSAKLIKPQPLEHKITPKDAPPPVHAKQSEAPPPAKTTAQKATPKKAAKTSKK